MRLSCFLVLFSVTLIPLACEGDPTGPIPELEWPAIRTDQTSYHAAYLDGQGNFKTYGFEIVAKYTNLTDRPVFLGRCQPNSPDPMYSVEGVGFHSAYEGVIDCTEHENHFRLKPGKARVDTLLVTGPQIRTSDGEAWGFLYGEFRLRYFVAFCESGCAELVPDSLTVSEPFLVTVDGWPFPIEMEDAAEAAQW